MSRDMVDVPDIKLIRTDTTLDLYIWAILGRPEAKVPVPFLLLDIFGYTCLVILFKSNRKVRAMRRNKYIYRCVAKCFIYG